METMTVEHALGAYEATIEQAGDGTWTAWTCIGAKNLVLGTGATREDASGDLALGIDGLAECLNAKARSR